MSMDNCNVVSFIESFKPLVAWDRYAINKLVSSDIAKLRMVAPDMLSGYIRDEASSYKYNYTGSILLLDIATISYYSIPSVSVRAEKGNKKKPPAYTQMMGKKKKGGRSKW